MSDASNLISDARLQARGQLESLRERFTAVNFSSRSLRLVRCTQSGALDLSRLAASAPDSFSDLTGRLGRGLDGDMALVPQQAADAELGRLAGDVRVLHSHARSDWLETGLRDLAVGWPFLEGRTADGTWLRAPLLLYPAWLERTAKGRLEWRLALGEPPVLNEALALTLQRIAGVGLTLDALLEQDDDRTFAYDGPTWGGFVACLRGLGMALLRAPSGLPPLAPVKTRHKDERERAPLHAFQLVNHLVLGRFPPSGSSLVGDYNALLDGDLRDLGMVASILGVDEPGQSDPAPQAPHHEAFSGVQPYLALASDGSQDAVLRWLGRDTHGGVVVQGPPGTGKSQLIANVVTTAIALGWRVLVVCEKRAALDVVEDRLVSIGLGEPLALVHDVVSDRNAVCGRIADTLDSLSDAGPEVGPEPLDNALSRAAARVGLAQASWRDLTGRPSGRPALSTLYERSMADAAGVLPALAGLVAEVSESDLAVATPVIEALAIPSEPLATPHPLAVRDDFAGRSDEALAKTLVVLEEAVERLGELTGPDATMTPTQALAHEQIWEDAAPALDLFECPDAEDLHRFMLFWSWTGGASAHGAWHSVMQRLRTARRDLTRVPYELVVAADDELAGWVADLEELARLRRLWYRAALPSFWRLRDTPQRVMSRCPSLGERPALVSRDSSRHVSGLCQQARGWGRLIEDLPQDNPFLDFGFQGDPEDISRAIDEIRDQHRRVDAIHNLHAALRDRGGPYADLPQFDGSLAPRDEPLIRAALADRRSGRRFRDLAHWVDGVAVWLDAGLLGRLRAALEDAGQGHGAQAAERIGRITHAWDDAVEARRLDELTAGLAPWGRAFLRHWRRDPSTGTGPGDDLQTAMNRAWRDVALAGSRRAVMEAPLVLGPQLDALARDVAECRKVAAAGVRGLFLQRIAQRRATHAKALRLLGAEARKRRRRLTLRQLIDKYWDLGLAQVRPVWLCSPDSVASMFPLQRGLFDLVVFDEASQCPVESALPVILRGGRVLVAGDDQQMPPSAFFRAANDVEDDDSTLLASQSLLELARVAFPTLTLRWHYRSRHESLVAFSNAAFYRGELYTAPRPEKAVLSPVEGLHYVAVDGLWNDQKNVVEAERVVDLIGELLASTTAEGRTPTLGVVTFNLTQAELIEERMAARYLVDPEFRARLATDQLRLPIDQLFVRNLENVQGDERDVIVFSTGYGRGEPGGRVHARFGPVGLAGGEKRLNVAITRARLGIYLVTSFDPDELDVSHTRHAGPKLLMQYLRYVRAVSAGRTREVLAILRQAASLNDQAHAHIASGSSRRLAGGEVRRQLVEALRSLGLEVETDFGVGRTRLDVAVSRRGSPSRVGVDCGAFLDIEAPLTRDVYSRGYWARLGWRVIRVTPGMWCEEREAVVARIVGSL